MKIPSHIDESVREFLERNSERYASMATDFSAFPDKRVAIARRAVRATSKLPERNRMEAINILLGGYGVEAIRGEWQNGYWCDIVADYVNMGDTYAITVMHVRGEHSGRPVKFIVTSWGDWVERNEKKFRVQ